MANLSTVPEDVVIEVAQHVGIRDVLAMRQVRPACSIIFRHSLNLIIVTEQPGMQIPPTRHGGQATLVGAIAQLKPAVGSTSVLQDARRIDRRAIYAYGHPRIQAP